MYWGINCIVLSKQPYIVLSKQRYIVLSKQRYIVLSKQRYLVLSKQRYIVLHTANYKRASSKCIATLVIKGYSFHCFQYGIVVWGRCAGEIVHFLHYCYHLLHFNTLMCWFRQVFCEKVKPRSVNIFILSIFRSVPITGWRSKYWYNRNVCVIT